MNNKFFPKITIQTLIISSLLLIIGVMLLVSYFSGKTIVRSLQTREEEFIHELVNISLKQINEQLQEDTVEFGNHFIERDDFIKAFKQQDLDTLKKILTDPFISGYINASSISIEALRLYRKDWSFMLEGRTKGQMMVEDYALETDHEVIQAAKKRQGKDRLRIFSGSWKSQHDALRSVIIPIGGIWLKGYIEIIVNTNLNLPMLEKKIAHSISIKNLITNTITYQTKNIENRDKYYIIHHLIHSLANHNLFEVDIFIPQQEFVAKIDEIQNKTIFITVVSNTLIAVFVLIFLHLLLIRPLKQLRKEIHKRAEELSDEPVCTKGLREFHQLANDFNYLVSIVKKQNDTLAELSRMDNLTQIPNRRVIDEFLQICIKRISRTPGNSLALAMIDIDYFKKYNDSYGHQDGDKCLSDVAQAIKQGLKRETDFIGRYGGEEFTAILPATDLAGAKIISESILEQVRALKIPHQSSEVSDYVSISLGLAWCKGSDTECLSRLVKQADENLYKAKHSGRNQYYCHL
ncbi:MAG: diguanylate cyclase [Gammaproteobacteria bacterium]|nr:diguanylate cyclase [Gammaproteobacteria bacterium]